jgi:hypothetical protein
MGQIIPFRCEKRRRAPPAADAASTGAEILFFLGVRYCRDDNGGKTQNGGGAPTRPSSRPRRKKRA